MKRTKKRPYKINTSNRALIAFKDNIVHFPHTRFSYKNKICAPRKRKDVNNYSCYTNEMLKKLKDIWNQKHSDNPIVTNVPVDIWKEYQEKIGSLCDTEECWLDKPINTFFAPPKPNYDDKNEWLSNIDIANVLKQYETVYHCFEFLGPTPIDYDTSYQNGFVCNKIAKFQLSKYIQEGKTKIGFVFNLDKHTQGGSHWVCLFVNIKHKFIYYFDSVGNKMHSQIKKLVDRIISQGYGLSPSIQFHLEINKTQHQRKNNECGVYCLFVITTLLQDTKNLTDFKREKYPDDDIYQLRSIFFQKE
jgi:hypothetical protein